jgi:hypothetical protein
MKEKKKKKKEPIEVVPDETELITPDSDMQQIYMQIMTLVYHKVTQYHTITQPAVDFHI